VLDEADRMLDMGFIHDLRRILALLPKKRQNLLFSATYSDDIRKLAAQFLSNPVEVEVARRNTAAETVTQVVHPVEKGHKRALLSHLIGSNNWRQVLVFTRTKHGANRLAEQLEKDGLPSAAIHGNKSQGARTRALAEFKGGKIRVLVATDIAARGLDIDQLPHVVNYELPQVAEDYVHRIGRTGRAGSDGEAVSLVSGEERGLLAAIERLLGKRLPAQAVTGFEMKGVGDVEVERERAPQQRRRNPPNGNRAARPAGAPHGATGQRHEHPARARRQDTRRP
jgi:ATP-dependent RNA helicase RhlE